MNSMKKTFGWHLMLDLFECDAGLIQQREAVANFARELCALIKMRRFGEPLIEKFGAPGSIAEGYSLVQLIETSAMVAHFSDRTGAIYLDIFSCKEFDPKITKKFVTKYFKAKKLRSRFIKRGI